jgi:hypothetical protein
MVLATADPAILISNGIDIDLVISRRAHRGRGNRSETPIASANPGRSFCPTRQNFVRSRNCRLQCINASLSSLHQICQRFRGAAATRTSGSLRRRKGPAPAIRCKFCATVVAGGVGGSCLSAPTRSPPRVRTENIPPGKIIERAGMRQESIASQMFAAQAAKPLRPTQRDQIDRLTPSRRKTCSECDSEFG